MKYRSSWLMKKLRYFFQYRLTPVGRMAVLLMFLSAVGLISVEIPVYQLFCGIVVLFGLVEMIGSLFRPKLKVTATFPEKVTVGDRSTGYLTIRNDGYFPAFDLMCAGFLLPQGIQHLNPLDTIFSLSRGQTANLPLLIRANRRGQFDIRSMWVHSTFPLNFMRVGNSAVPLNKLIVVPTFVRIPQLDLPISQRFQEGGTFVDSVGSHATEYSGNRDYVPGEPTNRLDFRAWARVGKPVVREYQEEYCSRVSIVLDNFVSKNWFWERSRGGQDLEAAISLAASITDSIDYHGAIIELFAAGRDVFSFESLRMSSSTVDAVLEILSAIEPVSQDPMDQLGNAIRDSLDSISVMICLFVDWSDSRRVFIEEVIASGCLVKVLLVRSKPPTVPIPDYDFLQVISPESVMAGDICLV